MFILILPTYGQQVRVRPTQPHTHTHTYGIITLWPVTRAPMLLAPLALLVGLCAAPISAQSSKRFPLAPVTSSASCPLTASTAVAIYADEAGGVGPGSHAWTGAFFAWWSEANPSLEYVELSADNIAIDCSLDEFASLALYVQPGGDASEQSSALGPSGRDNILNYLFYVKGAHYQGTCAGSFYASGTYWWNDVFEGAYAFTPHLFPTQEGPIAELARYPAYTATTVTTSDGDKTMIYYGGPALGLNYTSKMAASAGTVLSTYSDIRGGAIAATVRTPQLLLHSPHPEAVEGVHLACDPPLPPGCITAEQRLENWQWLAATINDFLGKSWVVPAKL